MNLAAIALSGQGPIATLNAWRVDGIWTLPITIDAEPPKSFIVDTGSSIVVWQKADAPKKDYDLHVVKLDSSVAIVGVRVWRMNMPGLAEVRTPLGVAEGLLGMDFLAFYKVGFDFEKSQISFFAQDCKPDILAAWAKGATDSPHPARVLPLEEDSDGLFGLRVRVGGKSLVASVDTGSAQCAIVKAVLPSDAMTVAPSSLTGAINVDGQIVISNDLLIPETENWSMVCSANISHFGDSRNCKAMVDLAAFGSRRVLFDFDRKRLYLEPRDTEISFSMFLTQLIGVPLRVRGDALIFEQGFLDTRMDSRLVVPKEQDRVPVLRIGDITGTQILAALRKPSAESRKLIARLLKLRLDGVDLVLGAADKPYTIHLKAFE